MDHVPRLGFLNGHAVDDQALVQALHRIAVELFWNNPRPLGGERVMALTDEPVLTGAVTTRRTPATIGYIHGDHVAEHVVVGSARRDVLTLTPEYDSQLDLPFDSVTAIRHHDVITAADDRAAGRLEEQVRYPPILLSLPGPLRQLLRGAAFTRVCVEVDRGIHVLAGIHDRRKDVHVFDTVNVVCFEQVITHHVVYDLVDPRLQTVLVLLDQVEHVSRCVDMLVRRISFERRVRCREVDDQSVP